MRKLIVAGLLLLPVARARLSRHTGDPDPSIVGAPPDLTINRAALLSGVGDLPSLRALDAQTAVMDAENLDL